MRLITSLFLMLFICSSVFASSFKSVSKTKSKSLNSLHKIAAKLNTLLEKEYVYEHAVYYNGLYSVKRTKDQATDKMLRQFLWVTTVHNSGWSGHRPQSVIAVKIPARKFSVMNYEGVLMAFNHGGGTISDYSNDVAKTFEKFLLKLKKVIKKKHILFYETGAYKEKEINLSSNGIVVYDSKTQEILSINTALDDH